MKRIVVAVFLFITAQQWAVAQNVTSKKVASAPKKILTVKDLNALETEKIKALVVKSTVKADTLIPKDTLPVKTQALIIKAVKKDTIKAVVKGQSVTKNIITSVKKSATDSVFKKTQPIDIASEKPTELLEKKLIPKEITISGIPKDTLMLHNQVIRTLDTSYGVSSKVARLADSIRNAHKHWLDSTLAVLPAKKPVIINKDDEIEIFITGGGLYTGVNPTVYNRLTIYNSGLVHKETKTKLQGEKVEDKKITKDALRKLAQYIIDQGFFDFNYLYDCDSKDKDCNTRLKMNPEPSPLSVVVTVGARRKKIYVALYAPHIESNWVNYPANLEKIVNAIYEVAGR